MVYTASLNYIRAAHYNAELTYTLVKGRTTLRTERRGPRAIAFCGPSEISNLSHRE